MLVALLLGLVSGFVGSMPVAGPVAVLVLRAAFRGRARAGLQIAFGCAIAEGLYGALAFVGVGQLAKRYTWFGPLAGVVGACILVLVGVVLMLKHQTLEVEAPRTSRLVPPAAGNWLLGFSVTALNPTIVASWTAVVTTWHGMGLVHEFSWRNGAAVGLGIASGVVLWFYMLVALVTRHRDRVSEQTLERVVRLLGLAMVLGGLLMLAPHVRHYLQSAG